MFLKNQIGTCQLSMTCWMNGGTPQGSCGGKSLHFIFFQNDMLKTFVFKNKQVWFTYVACFQTAQTPDKANKHMPNQGSKDQVSTPMQLQYLNVCKPIYNTLYAELPNQLAFLLSFFFGIFFNHTFICFMEETRVSMRGVKSLWVDCRLIPIRSA